MTITITTAVCGQPPLLGLGNKALTVSPTPTVRTFNLSHLGDDFEAVRLDTPNTADPQHLVDEAVRLVGMFTDDGDWNKTNSVWFILDGSAVHGAEGDDGSVYLTEGFTLHGGEESGIDQWLPGLTLDRNTIRGFVCSTEAWIHKPNGGREDSRVTLGQVWNSPHQPGQSFAERGPGGKAKPVVSGEGRVDSITSDGLIPSLVDVAVRGGVAHREEHLPRDAALMRLLPVAVARACFGDQISDAERAADLRLGMSEALSSWIADLDGLASDPRYVPDPLSTEFLKKFPRPVTVGDAIKRPGAIPEVVLDDEWVEWFGGWNRLYNFGEPNTFDRRVDSATMFAARILTLTARRDLVDDELLPLLAKVCEGTSPIPLLEEMLSLTLNQWCLGQDPAQFLQSVDTLARRANKPKLARRFRKAWSNLTAEWETVGDYERFREMFSTLPL